jgi:hypothetical protein
LVEQIWKRSVREEVFEGVEAILEGLTLFSTRRGVGVGQLPDAVLEQLANITRNLFYESARDLVRMGRGIPG